MRLVPTWADLPVDKNKFDRNAVEIPRYADIERQFSSGAQQLVRAYETQQISREEVISQFRDMLKGAETQAFVAGRRAKGDTSPTISQSESAMLAGRHSRNMRYFHKFVDDITKGTGRMDYAKRADLYAKSLWSLYTRAESVDWDDPELNARYYWVMDPASEHCPTCLERAKMSRQQDGFTFDELAEIGFPGENTECQVRCRCHIRVVKKRLLLPERIEDLKAAKNGDEGLNQLKELLGGEEMPIKVPAAGLPFVKVTPEIVNQSLNAAAETQAAMPYANQLGSMLPLLPLLLTLPEDKAEMGPDEFVFTGYGLDAKVIRSEGIFELAQLILSGDDWMSKELK